MRERERERERERDSNNIMVSRILYSYKRNSLIALFPGLYLSLPFSSMRETKAWGVLYRNSHIAITRHFLNSFTLVYDQEKEKEIPPPPPPPPRLWKPKTQQVFSHCIAVQQVQVALQDGSNVHDVIVEVTCKDQHDCVAN